MSKSARLKRLKEERMKNDEAFRKKEEERKKSSSKAMKKFMRSESIWVKILKFIMVLSFLYSGFFYGGITVLNILYLKSISWINHTYGVILLFTIIVMLIAIILAFKRLYILSFLISLVSTLTYFYITQKYLVDYMIERVNNGWVPNDGSTHPEYEFMIRHYPILLLLLCSSILFVIEVNRLIKKRRREKKKRDNAPTKSIVDD